VGRFLNRDPIRWAGALNLYNYCEGDPVGGIDPTGRAEKKKNLGDRLQEGAAAALRIVPEIGMAAWRVIKRPFETKLAPGTPTFGNANPDWPSAAALRNRGHEISDGIDEMVGGIMLPAVVGGGVKMGMASRAPCTGTGGGGYNGGGGGGGTQKALPPGKIPNYQNPWAGTPVSMVIQREWVVYRVWSGAGSPVSDWLTPIKPLSTSAAKSGFALPPQSAATHYSVVRIPAGTRLQYGTAGPAFGQPGGLLQIELVDKIPLGSYGPPIALPP
jgi:hypothetical protein